MGLTRARMSTKEASDRGQATHVAMSLLKDNSNIIRLASTRRLPALMRHKAENLVDRVRRRNEALDKNFLRAVQHQLWASLCCRHMAEFLGRMGVTQVLAVEHRLPPVRVHGIKDVDTGEIDILAYSEAMDGLVAVEVKNRINTDACDVAWGRAMENAAGVVLLSGRQGWPPLRELVWVFYTPHARNVHIPMASEKVLGYTADKVVAYFERRHGGIPHLPFLL